MNAYIWWLIAAATAFVCAAFSEWFLRRQGVVGRIGTVVAVGLLYVTPLLPPGDLVRTRAMTALVAILLTFKILDFRRHCIGTPDIVPSRAEFLRFLIPFPLVLLFGPHRSQLLEKPRLRPEVLRLVFGTALFAAVFLALPCMQRMPSLQASFLLDHSMKVGLFVVAIESLSMALLALERLAGFDTRPLGDRVYLSRTVAEFWLRYNTRVHDWLYHNVFQRTGGRRTPVRAVFLTFFVSGVFHEWMFGIATSRFDGYQFAFFMLQAPACLLSSKLQRLARQPILPTKILAHGITIGWFTLTSILFFHGVNRVFDFTYAAESWLP